MFYLACEDEVDVAYHRGKGYFALPINTQGYWDMVVLREVVERLFVIGDVLGVYSGKETALVCTWWEAKTLREVMALPVVWYLGEEGEEKDLPRGLEGPREGDKFARTPEEVQSFFGLNPLPTVEMPSRHFLWGIF